MGECRGKGTGGKAVLNKPVHEIIRYWGRRQVVEEGG